MQKAEEKEEPEDSLEEYSIACSNSHGPCESKQPHSNTKITFEEDQVNSRLIDSSSQDEWEDAVSIIPGSLYFPCVSFLSVLRKYNPEDRRYTHKLVYIKICDGILNTDIREVFCPSQLMSCLCLPVPSVKLLDPRQV